MVSVQANTAFVLTRASGPSASMRMIVTRHELFHLARNVVYDPRLSMVAMAMRRKERMSTGHLKVICVGTYHRKGA